MNSHPLDVIFARINELRAGKTTATPTGTGILIRQYLGLACDISTAIDAAWILIDPTWHGTEDGRLCARLLEEDYKNLVHD
jgi:hypothetical protein